MHLLSDTLMCLMCSMSNTSLILYTTNHYLSNKHLSHLIAFYFSREEETIQKMTDNWSKSYKRFLSNSL